MAAKGENGGTPRLLVLSGGHPYEEEPFDDLIQWLGQALGNWDVTHLVHPEAEDAVAAGAADDADALLFYDMAGYTFADGTVTARAPSEAYKAAITRRFASGRGAVAMHHALAGWALWPEWAEMLGGRFLYQPGEVAGAANSISMPDSGYRHDVTYQAQVVADHPVTRGVPQTFTLTDELYLAPIDEARIRPLIRAAHEFVPANFYSAAQAVAGQMFSNEGWDHPAGSNCVAWERMVGDAMLIYLQFGDGPETYRDPNVRKLLVNALKFTGETK